MKENKKFCKFPKEPKNKDSTSNPEKLDSCFSIEYS